MSRRSVRDMCGSCCVYQLSDYGDAELFVYLIGTGVSRSVYELTAHDRASKALLFDLRLEADPAGLERRARSSGTDSDGQAVALAINVAQRVIDAKTYIHQKSFRLLLDDAGTVRTYAHPPAVRKRA
jgi:hypothetical protein